MAEKKKMPLAMAALICVAIAGAGCAGSTRPEFDSRILADQRVPPNDADGPEIDSARPSSDSPLDSGFTPSPTADSDPAPDTTLDSGPSADTEVDTTSPSPSHDGPLTRIWSASISLVENLGRLAIGNRVHIVGHTGGKLVHRSSADDGANWTNAKAIAPAAGNYPGMYGGFFAQGDNLYLITGVEGDMGAGPRQIDFRTSPDNGATWSDPLRITNSNNALFRARIVASGDHVHVVGVGEPTPDTTLWYFRSDNGGQSFAPGVALATNLGPYGGGQTVAVDGTTVHVPYTLAQNGVGAGPTKYIRSTDNGENWSEPVDIGENSPESFRQARVQIVAVDGHVFACWQREGPYTGAPLPADRIGYNLSADGGKTWGTARVLPQYPDVNRNHPQVWMASGGGLHLIWRHGNGTTDPAGYMYSPDYGATWERGMIAIDTPEANHPISVVADQDAVHALTAPADQMQYARRLLR